MNDADGAKRASSSTLRPSSLKRAKTEHHDAKLECHTPPPLPLAAPQGVERIPFSASLNPNRLSSHYIIQLASERTNILRRQGRNVVGLPLVLNDGIVLNWVRDRSGSVEIVRSHNASANGPIVRQSVTRLAERTKGKPRIPIVPTGFSSGANPADAIVIGSDDEIISEPSGTSAANAISIDADEEINPVLTPPRADSYRGSPINHGTSLNKEVNDYSDSDTVLSSVDSEREVEGDSEAPYHLPPPLPAVGFDRVPLNPSLRHASPRDEDIVPLSGLRAGTDVDVATSDSEADGTDKEVDTGEDADSNRVSPRHVKPLPRPSLALIRKLLERGKHRGDPERDAPPQRTIVAPGVSKKQGREEFPKEAPAITSSTGEGELHRPASDPQLKRVPLPKTNHGRARRLLSPESADLPLVAVTMRGDCHFIERKKKHRISGYSLPNPGVFRHVGDVCMVGNTAVLGCDRGTHQISFLSVVGRPQMIDVTWSPHSSGPRYQDMQKRGVSRLAAIHAEDGHIKFLSGGYDGTIHRWTAGIERLNEPRSRKVASHGASIMALAYRDRDRSVMASVQSRLHITDLNRCKTMTHPVSNDIQQIHIHPQAAYLTLLEVRHLDRQIQLYDSRKGNFDSEPCLSFGRRNANGMFSRAHTRGSVHLVHFAMASEDRGVLLWDFRNCKGAVIEGRFQQAEKVVHTIFADSDIATFGQGVVTFFEDYLAQ